MRTEEFGQQGGGRQSENQRNLGQQEEAPLPGNRLDEGWQEEGLTEEEWREEERRERERQQRRRQRIEEMKREKRRREMIFRYGVPAMAVTAVLCIIFLVAGIVKAVRSEEDKGNGKEDNSGTMSAQGDASDSVKDEVLSAVVEEAVLAVLRQIRPGTMPDGNFPVGTDGTQLDLAASIGIMLLEAPKPVFEAHTTEHTNGFSDNITSEYGIMIDVESGEVLAQKDGWSRINPASMTKMLTVLVAAEHMTDWEGTFTMTINITDYSFLNDCSSVGFDVGEEIPVRDLFYGTALASGADAALGLAVYVAGSHEAFVDMMNAKLEELGLSETSHFTNCIGLYDPDHYSTPYDMAVILKEAADNEFCRQVLSEHHYVTAFTPEHPEGIGISNWFLRRIEDRDTHGEVLCAKTGYVDQSKNCAASLAADHNGREYICVTAGSNSGWFCIRDHVELYQRYLPQ